MTRRGTRGRARGRSRLDATSQVAAERALLASVFSTSARIYWPLVESTQPDDYRDPVCKALRSALDRVEHAPKGLDSIAAIVAADGGMVTASWLSTLIDEGCSNAHEAELCRDAIVRSGAIRALDQAVRSEDPIAEARSVLELEERRAAECGPRSWPGLMSGQDLFDMAFPAREAILGRWLYPGDRMLLHGPRGSGKSHLAMGIALAIAAGPEGPGLLGWTAPAALPVLYIDFELGARRLQRILHSSVFATHPPTPTGLLQVVASYPRVADADGLKGLTRLIDHIGPRVVVVDSQTFAFSVESENDAAEWAPYADWINLLSQREIVYIGLGHDGRVEGHARGTSAREDSLDLVLALEKKGPDGSGIDISLRWTKTRGLAPGDAERLHVRLGSEHGPEDSSPAWWWERDEDADRDRRDALNARAEAIRSLSAQGLQQLEIAARLGVSKWVVHRVLRGGSRHET